MNAGTVARNERSGSSPRRGIAVARASLMALRRADITALAAEAAYYSTLAIAPFIIFLTALAALVNRATDLRMIAEIKLTIWRLAPSSTALMLDDLITNSVERIDAAPASAGLAVSAAVALWSGSWAIQALVKGFDRVYGVADTRSALRLRIVSGTLAVLMAVLINVAVALFLFGGAIGRWVASLFGMGGVFHLIWSLLSWPLAVIVMMALLALLYYAGPNVPNSFRWVSPGAIVATVLWVLVVLGFRVWLSFVDPTGLYGALGSFVLLLVFVYLTAVVLLLGAAVNAVVEGYGQDG